MANAKRLAGGLIERGFQIVSGGTDTHVMLVDVRARKVTGKQAEELLGRAGMTVNRNSIPNDPAPPFVTSGVRLGTPAMTTRGMNEPEMTVIAELIDRVLTTPDDATITKVRNDVLELTRGFPLYESRRTAGTSRR